MDNTHYWDYNWPWDLGGYTIPAEAVTISREIIEQAYTAGLIQFQYDDPRPPYVTKKQILFNGVGEAGHEMFFFDVDAGYRTGHGSPFVFRMTAYKSYDAIVMKVLIALKSGLHENLEIKSDGSFAEEWQAARDEMREQYGIDISAEEHLIA